jgi:hypothetical protein
MLRFGTLPSVVLLVACGSTPPPVTPESGGPEQVESQRGPGLEMSSEIGALDEGAVTKTFDASVPELTRCLGDGAKRVEYLGGAVDFVLRIDETGQVAHSHLERSTLGDRATEQCMLRALGGRSWPKPMGGKSGIARKGFEFDPPNDTRPPTEWSADRVGEALTRAEKQLTECKGDASGSFEATLYVDTSGKAIGVGVTPPDEPADSKTDCIVEVLRGLSYPSPGSWPAKVTFKL